MTGILGPAQFREVDGSSASAVVAYLERVAADPAVRAYKEATLAGLGVGEGGSVLDVGCGAGVDLPALSRLVGPAGSVVGIDLSEALVASAGARAGGAANVTTVVGDAHRLPFADGVFDAARIDRVLLHVDRPAVVIREMARVVRPCGRVVASEGDWGTLVVAPAGEDAGRLFRAAPESGIRHPTVGRDLPALMAAAGLRVVDVAAATAVLRELEAADALLQLRALAAAAVAFGDVTGRTRDDWFACAAAASAAGTLLASLTGFIVVGEVV